MFQRTSLVVAAFALLAAGVPAQVQKGATPPALKFDKVWNDGPQSWDDLAGKVVILDFARTW
jgi:hypothetical protein